MDDIELAILTAWKAIQPKLMEDPAELKRRLARRGKRSLSRPPRAWCLAIRASDRRLEEYGYEDGRQYTVGCRQNREDDVGEEQNSLQPTAYRLPTQSVFVDSHMLRDLCSSIHIQPGGDTWDRVAKQLGTNFRGLQQARVSGRLRARYVPHLGGRPGKGVPILSSPDELDPQARGFVSADSAWGWTAQYLTNRIPEDLFAELKRVPIYRSHARARQFDETEHPEVHNAPRKPTPRLPAPPPDYVWYKWSKKGEFLGENPRYWRKYPSDPGTPPPAMESKPKRRRKSYPRQLASGSLQFRGWMWVCPTCGRKVRTIYLPVRKWSVTSCQWSVEGKETPVDVALTTGHQPSTTMFACYQCHRVRGFSRVDRKNSWNELVSYFSGGLLYGREVERPAWFDQDAQRKHDYRPRLCAPRMERTKADGVQSREQFVQA